MVEGPIPPMLIFGGIGCVYAPPISIALGSRRGARGATVNRAECADARPAYSDNNPSTNAGSQTLRPGFIRSAR